MPKFRTPYNYDHTAERKESNLVILDVETGELKPMPSCTTPDQTISIRDILDRTRRGQIVTGALKAVYDSSDILPDPRTLDYVERQEMLEKATQELAELKDRQDKRKAADAAKKAQERNEWAAFQKLLKQKEEGAKPDATNTTTP